MKKTFIILLIVLASHITITALPGNLKEDEEGWIEFSIGYTAAFPITPGSRLGHNISLGVSIVNKDGLGGGANLTFGESLTELTGNIQYHADVLSGGSIPVYLKTGIIQAGDVDNMGFGLGITSGIKYFLFEDREYVPQSDQDYEYSYTTLDLLASYYFKLFQFKGPRRVSSITALSIDLGYAGTIQPGGGGGWVRY